ncbi:MAG: class I SAM-dependent RNA methyltransferase [Spirochaetes bacterium]|nr:class I SAM-dependent RNA methyltransferase [Spirochaetota bacterium]
MNIRKLKPGAFVELECKAFVAEGLGLSYFVDEALKEQFKPHVFFIWGVLPGERFVARLAQVKSKHAHGVLARRDELPPELVACEFIHPAWALATTAVERQEPRCENYLRCGGCRMQHMSYETTTAYKTGWLRTQLERSKVTAPEIVVEQLPDAALWHYRNHVQIHINKYGTYGFYEPLSYRTRAFPEHGCLIFREKDLRGKLPKYSVAVRAARIRMDTSGAAVFTELNSKNEADTLAKYTVAWPPGQTTEIEFPVTSFFQVNLNALPVWLTQMADYYLTAAAGKRRVFELFSGFGFISRMLAQRFDFEILATDLLSKEQVERVKFINNGRQCSQDFSEHYYKADLFLPERLPSSLTNAVQQFQPELLIINPPRAGLLEATWKKFRESALKNFSGTIIYSSCNAATLARDLAYFSAEGYRVQKMHLFDFFPWTHHAETTALLVKS